MSGAWFVPHDLAEPVAGASSGPLAGLTAVVKDSFDVAGARTGAGSPDWLAAHPPASAHAAVVERVLAAGATVTGKTICDELFYSVTGANAHYGTPANVRAPGRLPGGSSSGSAAAVAAAACDFAIGGDTGGSVRVPAAFCGVYGIRPTHGRVDAAGAVPMAPSFDVVGWFASGPGVFRNVGGVLLDGPAVRSPLRRLLVAADAFEEADPAVAAAVEAFLRRAAGALPGPERLRVAPEGLDAWRESFRIVQAHEVWSSFGAFVTQAKPSLGPGIRERVAFAATVADDDAGVAREAAARAREHVRALVEPGTLVVLPTAPCIAPPLDASEDELELFRTPTMRLTCISGLSGLPQVTLPAGIVDGCPVGVSLLGWQGADETLLDLAVSLARFCAWVTSRGSQPAGAERGAPAIGIESEGAA